MDNLPLIIHIPHSSTRVPQEVRKEILLDDNGLKAELLKMTDHFIYELAETAENYGHVIRFQYSRLVVDPERFRDDNQEVMASVGMGAVYTSTSDGKALRVVSKKDRENLLRNYYDPYHQLIEETTEQLLNTSGKCLIVDLHSFPSKPLPFELNQTIDRPHICIGSDSYHTPDGLVRLSKEYFAGQKLSVEENLPFSGTLVPIKFYRRYKAVQSIMIEINRSLYMNEITGEKLSQFNQIQRLVSEYIKCVSEFTV